MCLLFVKDHLEEGKADCFFCDEEIDVSTEGNFFIIGWCRNHAMQFACKDCLRREILEKESIK
jgi:hypothetical protein